MSNIRQRPNNIPRNHVGKLNEKFRSTNYLCDETILIGGLS